MSTKPQSTEFRLTAADPRSWLFWAGLPVIATQGLWLKRRAYRAAEAPGPQHGEFHAESGRRALKLCALGDSIIAGVALDSTADALPCQLARALSLRLGRPTCWQALGRNGADAREALALARQTPAQFADSDLLLLSIGVNDVTGLRRRPTFAREISQLIISMRRQSPSVRIVICATPPLEAFPLLPSPLRHLLGLRARQFDAIVRAAASDTDYVLHAALPFAPEPSGFAIDGFHPNADSVARWADGLAGQLQLRWPELGD